MIKRAQIALFFDIHQLFHSKLLMRSRQQTLKNSKAIWFFNKNSEQRNNDSVAILKILPPHCAVVVELQKLENLSAILGQKFFYFLSLLSCLKIINGFENSSPECVFSSMTPLLEQSEAEPTECMYRGSPTYTVFTTTDPTTAVFNTVFFKSQNPGMRGPFVHLCPKPWTMDAHWNLFSSKSQTFGLGYIIWEDKFWGIWCFFLGWSINTHIGTGSESLVHVFHLFLQKSLYIYIPNIYLE